MSSHNGDDAYRAACAHDRIGEEAEAIPDYELALQLGLSDEDTAGAMLGLGSSLRNVGRFADAVAVLKEGVQRYPQNAGLRAFLGLAHHSNDEAAAAVGVLLDLVIEHAPLDGYDRALSHYRDELG